MLPLFAQHSLAERYALLPESVKKNPCPSFPRFLELLFGCILAIIILHIFMSNFRARRRRSILTGSFLPEPSPPAQRGNWYRDWARRHRVELMINWRNIQKGRPLNRIKPL